MSVVWIRAFGTSATVKLSQYDFITVAWCLFCDHLRVIMITVCWTSVAVDKLYTILRALTCARAVCVEAVSYTHLDVYKRQT